MSVFEAPEFDAHEQIVFVTEPSVGLRAIIAIHNTTLGPSLGGVRMWPYDTDAAALRDVLRLSRGMTYKAATLQVALGGGKSVIIGDPRKQKTPQLMRAMGQHIDRLGGRYIAGEDIGTNPLDMKEIRSATRCVSCLHKKDGGYGDPAPLTALGVFSAMKAGLKHQFGTEELTGVRVAVQGVGNVGLNLCRLLAEAGAHLIISDVFPDRLQRAAAEFDCEAIESAAIFAVEAEVFAPCAIGAILNDETIPQLAAKVIAGAANNQLNEERHAQMLTDRGITYLPDYVANGGGLISCAAEWYRTDIEEVPAAVGRIYNTCAEIIELAEEAGETTNKAADRMALKVLGAARDEQRKRHK